ncbi:MAG: 16S rRNA (cytidine(1402)-2'-O)-methyltransferase [Firmicutes bacterium]|nr:16S rRNA (cytidine(1402)-2'-O)-methyltransferase [Bacillota bacterium]
MSVLYVIATPIGNLADISKRALEILNSVQYIIAEDTRHSHILLKHYKISKKLLSLHKFNETSKSGDILNRLTAENADAALVSDAGTPCISDPGAIFVKEARERNIEIIGIPGASALTTAISVSGIDANRFSFIGFFPKLKKEREDTIEHIKNSVIDVFVFFESPLRIVETLAFLLKNFESATIAVSNDLTKLFERTHTGALSDVYLKLKDDAKVTKGEYVIVFKRNSGVKKEIKNELSLEAKLLGCMARNNVGFKEAITILAENKAALKNDLYKASLNIKRLTNGE